MLYRGTGPDSWVPVLILPCPMVPYGGSLAAFLMSGGVRSGAGLLLCADSLRTLLSQYMDVLPVLVCKVLFFPPFSTLTLSKTAHSRRTHIELIRYSEDTQNILTTYSTHLEHTQLNLKQYIDDSPHRPQPSTTERLILHYK